MPVGNPGQRGNGMSGSMMSRFGRTASFSSLQPGPVADETDNLKQMLEDK